MVWNRIHGLQNLTIEILYIFDSIFDARRVLMIVGLMFTKLEIHGRLGMICHAIQQKSNITNAASSTDHEIHMFEYALFYLL